jgi:hypothetical protein
MKTRFTEIFRNHSAFGGYTYRVMSNGKDVRIEESNQGASWIARKSMSVEQFERLATFLDLYNVYNQNPAVLAKMAMGA